MVIVSNFSVPDRIMTRTSHFYRSQPLATCLLVLTSASIVFSYDHHHRHLFAQTRRRTHDQHENKSRTRKAQKIGAYILPIKKEKKHTRYKNNYYYHYYNYDYAYRKNAEKSTRLSDRLNLDNDENGAFSVAGSVMDCTLSVCPCPRPCLNLTRP